VAVEEAAAAAAAAGWQSGPVGRLAPGSVKVLQSGKHAELTGGMLHHPSTPAPRQIQ